MLLTPPPFTPFVDPRTARPPGLSPMDTAEWTLVMADYASQMRRREELLATERAAVIACLPEAEPAAAELLESLIDHLSARPDHAVTPDRVRRPDGTVVAIDRADPLATIGRLIAEDACLMLADPESGEYKLAAAVLCFPSRWLLSAKLGRPMTAIHAPVHDYDETMARRVNRVFAALRVEAPVWRCNWLIHATTELFLPLGASDRLMAAADPAAGLYLRTERQSLRRLARTGAIVFLIKTTLSPLDALAPQAAAAMLRELHAMAPETIAHRSASRVHAAALALLDRLARGAAAGQEAPDRAIHAN